MATAEEIIVKLTAQTAELKAGMAEGAAVVKKTQDEMAASMQTSMAAFRQFDAIQKGSITTAQELASAQAAVQAAQASGAFTAEEIAEKEALVAAAMKKVGNETQEASGVLSVFTRNSRTMYSTSALITDAMTGQFSRMRREVAALGNETGLMAQAFRFALSPAGLIAAALAAVGVAAYEASQKVEDLERAAMSGGGAAGMSGDQLEAMAEHFKSMGYDVSTARDALTALSKSGHVYQESMYDASQASLDWAKITGTSADKLAEKFANAGNRGARGFLELDESMHFLDDAQRKQMATLLATNDVIDAQKLGYQALAASGVEHVKELIATQGHAEGELARFGTSMANIWDSIGNFALGKDKGTSLEAQIAVLDNILAHKDKIVGGDKVINGYIAERLRLQKQLDAETGASAQRGKAAQAGAQADAEILNPRHSHAGGSVSSGLEATLQQEEADQKVSYDKRQQFEVEYWGNILNTAKKGSAEYVAAWKHTQDLQKQIDQQQLQDSQETARKQAQAAREAAEAAKRQFEQEAEAAKKAAQEKHAADEQAVDDAHTLAAAKISAGLQADRTLRANGQITARQLYEDQIDALNKQLTADVMLYQEKAKLAAGDAAEVMKWQNAILIDVTKTNQKMLKVQQDYADQVKRINKEIADEKIRDDQRTIMSGFREINQLIAHQETFKQALANIGLEILRTQEENVAKSIAAALNGEQGKTAAAAAGSAERLGITVAGEAQALAVQGASAIKWITTEAAKAAAGAFNAMVSIPYIGPFLAVGASIAAGAAVLALVGKVASAEGGWERVPADGMQTVLHKDEMVLPKRIADPVRNMARSGARGGGDTFKVYAQDARGLADFIRRNGGTLSSSLRRMARNGY